MKFDINKGFDCSSLFWLSETYQIMEGRKQLGNFYLNKSYTNKGYVHFSSFGILERKRGKGYGRRCMEKLISELKANKCKGMTLGCRQDNEVAKNLYKSLGFVLVENDFYRLKF